MPDPVPPVTPDQAVLDLKRRSRSLRVILDRAGVSKFRESLPQLDPIKVTINIPHALDTANYLYRLVKNPAERKAFLDHPRDALIKAGFREEAKNPERVVALVKHLVARSQTPIPSEIFDSYTDTETETHQQWNFDSSGRSSETTKGSIVGEKKDFSGFGLVEEIFSNPDFGTSYFPQQPLVTPQLVQKIRARLSPQVGGAVQEKQP